VITNTDKDNKELLHSYHGFISCLLLPVFSRRWHEWNMTTIPRSTSGYAGLHVTFPIKRSQQSRAWQHEQGKQKKCIRWRGCVTHILKGRDWQAFTDDGDR